MNRTALAVCVAVLISTAGPSFGAIVHVDWSGGGDYPTIQQGLNAAANGDTVLIAPGTYTGPENRALTFGSKNLVLEPELYFPTVVIDCEGQDRAFYLHSTGQDTTSVIRGLVIQNAYTDNYSGAGMLLSGVSVIVEDCYIKDCVASHNGGGIYISYTGTAPGPRIRRCAFEGNSAIYRGGGLMVDHASARIRGCTSVGNSTSGTGHDSYGGGAMLFNWVDDSPNYECWVSRCTLVKNSTATRGAGIYGYHSVTRMFVGQCIVAFNEGAALGVDSEPMIDAFTYSIVYGNEGGNFTPGYSTLIQEDPRFCDMAADYYVLCANSPGLSAGNIYGVPIGALGEGCGNCDSAVQETSWGGIKALFRR